MSHRSPARWLAPLALLLVVMAVAAVVLRPDEPTGSASGTGSATTRAVSDGGESTSKTRRRTYRVRSGDTLTSISIRTGVSIARLQALNPELDSDALQTGQRIKLRR
jgi:LysM repeat protein